MSHRVLVVDDEPEQGELLGDLLRRRGHQAEVVSSPTEALAVLAQHDIALVIADVHLGQGMTGLELCGKVRESWPDVPVIVVTGAGNLETAIGAIRAGAYDFVTKPLSADAIMVAVGRALDLRALRAEVGRLRREVDAQRPIHGILGESAALREVVELIRRVADSDATVLVTGESGTGKELVSRALHDLSPRRERPFVAINCAAVPANLLESELFGHVRGAFTDAKRDRVGLFEQAPGGTVFLDEIGEMPAEMQAKLLRVLQERRVRPIGGEEEREFDARVVCATNRDLESEVEAGRFREDLFYRVNVVNIHVPPLRDRGADVLALAQHFLGKIATRGGRSVPGLSPPAARLLLAYDWPGNVRELENCVERALALARGDEVVVDDLPEKIRGYQPTRLVVGGDDVSELITLEEMERRYVRKVLATVGGNKSQAARVLGIDRRSLYRRLETSTTDGGAD
ncbi:MAG: sigma-54 dependent transcriptional regulator [Kofleriaceae bacterium]